MFYIRTNGEGGDKSQKPATGSSRTRTLPLVSQGDEVQFEHNACGEPRKLGEGAFGQASTRRSLQLSCIRNFSAISGSCMSRFRCLRASECVPLAAMLFTCLLNVN